MLRFIREQSGVRGISRQEFLRIGGLGFMGLPALSRANESSPQTRIDGIPRVKSVIVVFASGGQSQLDMWDPKPLAPAPVRGEFGTIASSVPGTFLSEHLPKLAHLANKYTIVRTMSHADVDHGSAVYLTLTGQYHRRLSSNPAPSPSDLPSLMSVYQRLRPNTGQLAQAVQINGPVIVAPQDIAPGQFGGILGRDYEPMYLGNVLSESAAVPGLSPQAELPAIRLRDRERLLTALDRTAREIDHSAKYRDVTGQYHKAFELLTDPRTRQAFDLSAEPEGLRQRYGWNRAGQSCLLARRLAEAGVPLITVVWNQQNRGQDNWPDDEEMYGWDTHNDIFDALKNRLLPRFDQSFSALLEDIEARGMWDDTLVLCVTEFGRAPLVALERNFAGSSPGRKHWASAYSIVFAGAEAGRGQILGKTDRHGAYPASESYGPWDVAATIFAALGVSPLEHYHDSLQRPIPLTSGNPMRAVFGG